MEQNHLRAYEEELAREDAALQAKDAPFWAQVHGWRREREEELARWEGEGGAPGPGVL